MRDTYDTRAVVLDCDRPGQLTLERFELPAPAKGDLILQTELSGVCGSDLHLYHGWFKRGLIVPGHEFVGRVVEVGGEVLDAQGQPLKVGDLVVPESQVPCRRCRFCLGGGSRYDKVVDYNACESFFFFGSKPIGDPPSVIGGWSDYVQVPGNALLHKIEDDLAPLEAIVLLEPLSVAVKAVAKAGVVPGDTVVVQGPGIIGLSTVVAARAAGASMIMLTGASVDEARLRAGEMLGADLTVDLQRENPFDILHSATSGNLADRVIDASGAKQAFQQGLDMTGRSGVYVNIGGFRPEDEITFRPDRLKREKIDIRFSHMGTNAYGPALSIIRSRRFPLEKLVTHYFPLEEAERALQALEGREGDPIKVVLTFEHRAA
jgi:threonine dehydrogenase-like Zn-dependent dehydrogenase